MSTFSFFWHDYETFGRVPRHDRPAQFAGLRTNAELDIIGEPVMLYCQPAPDYLPDPEACLLTGILPQHAQEHGVPEAAFAAAIEAQLARPGTVGVGYNTLRFDDEVTRHLFWRNLIDPYAREYKNQCGRWDLLDTVRCMHALRPDGITWPQHEDGKVSFRLEDLSAANCLAHEAAHDALSDVHATLALARLVRQHQPRLWDFCLKLRHKEAVWAEIGQQRPFLHISGMYGSERGCMAVVWPLAPHPSNRNELIVWDLAHDPTELLSLDVDSLRLRLFSRADDLPEGVSRLPVKTIHVNKSPVVISNLRTLSAAQAQRWGLDLDAAARHARPAPAVSQALLGLWPDVFARPTPTTPTDVDEDLYGGFIGPTDRSRLDRLRQSPPDSPLWHSSRFEDARLAELVFRHRARNFPTALTAAEHQRWQHHCAARLHEGAGGALTLSRYFDRIDSLNDTADDRAQALLGALYDYAEEIAPPAR